jgi:hypothetical protein
LKVVLIFCFTKKSRVWYVQWHWTDRSGLFFRFSLSSFQISSDWQQDHIWNGVRWYDYIPHSYMYHHT